LEPQLILEKLSQYLVLLFSLSVHESAHAWTALRQGDDTGLREGRITLNPLVHIDILGSVVFPLFGLFAGGVLFGWAKPVPVRPQRFRQFRLGQILTAGAGPMSNFVLALVFTVMYAVAVRGFGGDAAQPVIFMARWGIVINVILGVFNLIPVPPLDGSWIASMGLPRNLGALYDEFVRPYGYMLLILLLISGGLSYVFDWVAFPIARELLQLGGGV
jgi:Zn-dependent protease